MLLCDINMLPLPLTSFFSIWVFQFRFSCCGHGENILPIGPQYNIMLFKKSYDNICTYLCKTFQK